MSRNERLFSFRRRPSAHMYLIAAFALAGCIIADQGSEQRSVISEAQTTPPSPPPSPPCDPDEFEEEIAVRNPADSTLALPPGWLNVKDFWQSADPVLTGGTKDWTNAFRRAIGRLSTGDAVLPRHGTLFVPAGTYAITDTLTLQEQGINIVGEDPATTTLAWYGSAYDFAADMGDGAKGSGPWMVRIDGSGHGTIKRLTFDGRGISEAAIRVATDQSTTTWPWYDPATGTTITRQKGSPSGFRFTDLVIQDVARGIWGGYNGPGGAQMDSEVYILRCTFRRIGQSPTAGPPSRYRAAVRNDFQNTQNWNVWDSVIEDSDTGVGSGGYGSFNVWRTTFYRSRFSDIYLEGTYAHLLRGNTSVGSEHFVVSDGHEKATTIIDNTILDPHQIAIDIWSGPNPTAIIDNKFRTNTAAIGFIFGGGYVRTPYSTYHNSDVLIVGNLFSQPSGWLADKRTCDQAMPYPSNDPRYCQFPQDSIIMLDNAQTSLSGLSAPPAPATPPRVQREHYWVQSTDTDNDIQAKLDAWGNSVPRPARPILFFPSGKRTITKQLNIPEGLDVQVVGDGWASQLEWAQSPLGLVYSFYAPAPARATIRDLHVIGYSQVSCDQANCNFGPGGILLESNDDAGGRVYLRGGGLTAALDSRTLLTEPVSRALLVDQLDNVPVRWDHAGLGSANIGAYVFGNDAGATSMANTAGTHFYGGSGSGSVRSSYRVDKHGKLVIQGVEHEGTLGIDLSGAFGAFTFVGAQYAVTTYSSAAFDLVPAYGGVNATNFHGNITLMNGDFGMPITRLQTHDGDKTFAYGYYYMDTVDEGAVGVPANHPPKGVLPGGGSFIASTLSDPLVYSDCAPFFNVAASAGASAALLGSRVYMKSLSPIAPGNLGHWSCQAITSGVSDRDAFLRDMLADLRASKPAKLTRLCSPSSTDAKIDGFLFTSNAPTYAVAVRRANTGWVE